MEANQIVLVMAVPADGAMQFTRILYLFPSSASVRERPRIAAFAVEYYVPGQDSIRDFRILFSDAKTYVSLSEVTVCSLSIISISDGEKELTNTNLRACRHNPTVLLFLEDRPNSFRALICTPGKSLLEDEDRQKHTNTPEMHSNDSVPFRLSHCCERSVAEDTSICDENVDRPKSIDGGLDNCLAILNGVDSCNCLSSSLR